MSIITIIMTMMTRKRNMNITTIMTTRMSMNIITTMMNTATIITTIIMMRMRSLPAGGWRLRRPIPMKRSAAS